MLPAAAYNVGWDSYDTLTDLHRAAHTGDIELLLALLQGRESEEMSARGGKKLVFMHKRDDEDPNFGSGCFVHALLGAAGLGRARRHDGLAVPLEHR